jgi:5-methylcytosine-specific restriction protein A
MQNKNLTNSKNNGVDLHLFESNSPNEYIYSGQVELAGEPY